MPNINPFKVSGPMVDIVTALAKCGCRYWPVVTHTLTWSEDIDGWKRESWGWRSCGYCHQIPIYVEGSSR